MRDVVVSALLAVRMMFAVAFLSVPFSDTLHGFNVVTVICGRHRAGAAVQRRTDGSCSFVEAARQWPSSLLILRRTVDGDSGN